MAADSSSPPATDATAEAAPRRVELDVTGKLCPLPVLLARRAIARLAPGDLLELVGDDPLMAVDVPVWVEKDGHVLRRRFSDPAGGIHYLVERGH